MADFIREISPPNLQAFAAAINDEEAGGSEFVKSTVSFFDSKFTNLAVFRELEPGQAPDAEVQAVSFGTTQPANTALVWSGAVIVGGTNVAVSVFR
jgi:hypothetical protein